MIDRDIWSEWFGDAAWNAGFLAAAIALAVAGTTVDSFTAPGGEVCTMLCSRHSSSWYLPLLGGSALLTAFGIVMGIVDVFTRKWTQAVLTFVAGGAWIICLGYLAFLRA